MKKSIITTVYKKDKQKILFSSQEAIDYSENIQLGRYSNFGRGCYLFNRIQSGEFLIVFSHLSMSASGTEDLPTKEEREFLYKKYRQFVLGKDQK